MGDILQRSSTEGCKLVLASEHAPKSVPNPAIERHSGRHKDWHWNHPAPFQQGGSSAVSPPQQLAENSSGTVPGGHPASSSVSFMHDVDTEATPLRARPRPYEPTQAERDAHEPLHVPYRCCCRACVAGRGRADAHHVSPNSENAVAVYAIDYAYLSSDADEQRASPILIGRDSITKWTDADVLPSKGTSHEHSIRTLVNNVRNTGHIKVIIKSDNEPAIVDLKHQAARRLQADHGISVTFEESPVSDSQSNGLAELAVREVKGLARTLKHYVEEMHGITLPPDHVSMPWLLQHVCAIIARA